MTLIPFYKAQHERYSVYWNLMSEAEWKVKPTKAAATAGALLSAD